MRIAGRVAADALIEVGRHVQPGITTDELDRIGHDAMVAAGSYPSTLNYRGYPKSLCTSVNEIVCHGIPDSRRLQDGDIVNVDVTAFIEGVHGDTSATFLVGDVDPTSVALVAHTRNAMHAGIAVVRPGARIRDIGKAIEESVRPYGHSIVREFIGHGIGDQFHTSLQIPHYYDPRNDTVLLAGMTFTIEPMVNVGAAGVAMWDDEWTVSTMDLQRTAQFEHTILVTDSATNCSRSQQTAFRQRCCSPSTRSRPTLQSESSTTAAPDPPSLPPPSSTAPQSVARHAPPRTPAPTARRTGAPDGPAPQRTSPHHSRPQDTGSQDTPIVRRSTSPRSPASTPAEVGPAGRVEHDRPATCPPTPCRRCAGRRGRRNAGAAQRRCGGGATTFVDVGDTGARPPPSSPSRGTALIGRCSARTSPPGVDPRRHHRGPPRRPRRCGRPARRHPTQLRAGRTSCGECNGEGTPPGFGCRRSAHRRAPATCRARRHRRRGITELGATGGDESNGGRRRRRRRHPRRRRGRRGLGCCGVAVRTSCPGRPRLSAAERRPVSCAADR